mmetsp:Transcript_9184/g.21463  ORF Transcript_9184/g.21463 Transcript_9184/m.21463 type:complete len:340 (-) Transcript_9184:63-1082(-)
MDFGDLNLQLETDTQLVTQNESWAVGEDGSLRHNATGILIGELGLRDGKTEFAVDPMDIEVDQTNLLGRGAGGIVARGNHKPTGTPLAVKVVRVEDKGKRSQLINELHNLLRITKSHFLIQLYAAYVHKDTGCVHVALEYMDYGSLTDVKQKVNTVPENILALIMMQILEGLKTLHLSYVVHRDVKLGNILVNSRGVVKVTDFGISKRLDYAAVCDTFVGTATHMSPERVLGEDYSFAADIWSLGLCVYELASGVYPYGSVASFPVLFDNLCSKPEPRLPRGKYTPGLCDFVECCLKRRPEQRATAIQLQAHKFILTNVFQVRQGDLINWLAHLMRDLP